MMQNYLQPQTPDLATLYGGTLPRIMGQISPEQAKIIMQNAQNLLKTPAFQAPPRPLPMPSQIKPPGQSFGDFMELWKSQIRNSPYTTMFNSPYLSSLHSFPLFALTATLDPQSSLGGYLGRPTQL